MSPRERGGGERRLVEVALPLPIHRTFTYAVETGGGDAPPPPGSRVLVPWRRGERIGWVVGHDAPEVKGVRPVLDVLDDEPSATPDLLELCRWVAEYYVAPLGLVLRSALPAVLTDASRDYVQLTSAARESGSAMASPPDGGHRESGGDPGRPGRRGASHGDLTPRERRLADALLERDGPQRVATLRKALGMGSIWPEIRSLKAAGLLTHETVPPQPPPVRTRRVVKVAEWQVDLGARDDLFGRAHRQREAFELLEASPGGTVELAHLTDQHGFSRSVVTGLEEKGLVEVFDEEVLRDPFSGEDPPEPKDHPLTPRQKEAVAALVRAAGAARGGDPVPVLLHGVTGSGKTRVYIELLRHLIGEGRGAVVLVPEISLTPQTVSRFRAWFGDEVAVLHSALSDGERYDAWRQLRSGEKRIAVGARSALFAPVADLGAVVVDEEHDGSYKQSESPRYHARDLAVVRAAMAGAACCLGSATPSLESWANADKGKFTLVSMPDRVGGGTLPHVALVDLRAERKKARDQGNGLHGGGILTPRLVEAVEESLSRGEQAILLLNRRGYSSFVQCRECGDVRECANCSISMTYHRVASKLVCHHCRHEEPAPERCFRCGSRDLSFRGLGTEQVERVVTETFGAARVARMDVDTTSGKWSHHEILGRVERGEVDILLGTQMIAKGLDFPRVTLVGVINADVGIHLPDFRASERTYQLLSQVAGRTGRGALGGRVLVQTSLPEHYAIQAALDHDHRAFAERELAERKRPAYPPWVRLVNVVISSPDQELAARGAQDAVDWIRRTLTRGGPGGGPALAGSSLELVGPAPSPIERLHGRWRWHFLLRSPSPGALGALCRVFVEGFTPRGKDVRVALDRDPTALL